MILEFLRGGDLFTRLSKEVSLLFTIGTAIAGVCCFLKFTHMTCTAEALFFECWHGDADFVVLPPGDVH